jgi:hypothetical protein
MMRKLFFGILILALALSACNKERAILYDVQAVYVQRDGTNKTRIKTTTEFISIVYSDIFGTTIPQSKLDELSLAYEAFGDKKLMEDIIVKNFLNSSSAQIPSTSTMNADIDDFIQKTFRKLYNREPGEMEAWKLKEMIKSNSAITPVVVYYAFMTSNEYRYY